MSTTAGTRLRRGAVLAAVAAMLVSLVPSATASAAALPTPQFAYLDIASGAASSNDAAGTVGTATRIMPTGYGVLGHDVAWDGRTWAGCIASGTSTTDPYDRTYGLVLVHTDGVTTSTKVLSTFCEANPVVSGDGAKVYWLSDDTVYRFDASYASGIAGTTSVVSTGQFVTATNVTGDPTEYVDALAVSRDGLSAAALYRSTSGLNSRVHASLLSTATTKPPAYNRAFVVPTGVSASSPVARASSFVFVTDTQLAYGVLDVATTPQTRNTGVVTVPGALDAASSAAPVIQAGYDDTYDLRPFGDASAPQTVTQWYVWKSTLNGTTYDEQLGSSPDFVTAPTGWATRADGATTERYVPTAVTPPVWSGPVSNLAAAHPAFRMLASVSPYGRQVGYVSYNLYEIDPLGAAYSSTNAAEVDRGLLERSYDGVHYYVFTTTSSKNVRVVGSTYVYGYSAKLVRNTWFRWTYKGDNLTAKAAPIVRVVKVVPLVTVKVAKSGTKRTVYGTATRVLGKVALSRKVGSVWRVVAYASISAHRVYTFGKRSLVRGTYRVTTIADKSWAAGVKVFAV